MGHAANLFGISNLYFSGTNGDISSSAGQLVVSVGTNNTRATYVDSDYSALRAKGYLAYPNLQLAVESWDTGGEAFVKFGAPTATGYGTIIIGPGIYEMASGAVPLDTLVDYLDIRGYSRDASILTNTHVATAGNVVRFNAGNINLSDFTLSPASTGAAGAITFVEFDGTISNIKVDGVIGQTWLSFNAFNGKIKNSDFDFSSGSAPAYSPLILGAFARQALVKGCTFLTTSEQDCLMRIEGTTFLGTVEDCKFYAETVHTAVVNVVSPTSDFASISNNKIVTNNLGTGIACTANTASFVLEDCYIATRNSALHMKASLNGTRAVDCYLWATDNNAHSVTLASNSAGFRAQGCRMVGQGTGLALFVEGGTTFDVEVAHCILRKPTSNGAGSSISSTLTSTAENPYNTEIDTSSQS